MTNETACQSSGDEVVNAFDQWVTDTEAIRLKRAALSDQYGRNLYVNRLGFGHGTRVVGFERFDSDKDGDLLADGALIVSSKRGARHGLIVPNMRRKAGREFDAHLREYNSLELDLPGMPRWHLSGSDGIWAHSPSVFKQDNHVLAFWACSDAPVDPAYWESIKLSHYYSVKEKYDAEH